MRDDIVGSMKRKIKIRTKLTRIKLKMVNRGRLRKEVRWIMVS